jgi:hypothetical protein
MGGRRGVSKAAIYIVATSCTRRMRHGGGPSPERSANCGEPSLVEPAIFDAAMNGPAIGAKLAGAYMVVPAFVVESKKPHGFRLVGDERRIEDEQFAVWHGDAKVG